MSYTKDPNDGKQQESKPFIPIEGQSFSNQREWINTATRRLTAHPEYYNAEHSEVKGWSGYHFTALCFDQKGRRCKNGGDFQRAEDEGAYPIYWLWPDQIVPLLTAEPSQ